MGARQLQWNAAGPRFVSRVSMSYRHTHHKGLRRGKPKFESSSDEDEERFSRFSQVVIPVEEERMRTAGLPVRWSSVDKEEAVKLSEDLLTASCHCGYRAVRASHGISEGCWFFELEIGGVAKDGEVGIAAWAGRWIVSRSRTWKLRSVTLPTWMSPIPMERGPGEALLGSCDMG